MDLLHPVIEFVAGYGFASIVRDVVKTIRKRLKGAEKEAKK